jgi:hypothetical protein
VASNNCDNFTMSQKYEQRYETRGEYTVFNSITPTNYVNM